MKTVCTPGAARLSGRQVGEELVGGNEHLDVVAHPGELATLANHGEAVARRITVAVLSEQPVRVGHAAVGVHDDGHTHAEAGGLSRNPVRAVDHDAAATNPRIEPVISSRFSGVGRQAHAQS